MKQYTANEFFEKLDWEGGFEGMFWYCGQVKITDNPDLDLAWGAYCTAMPDLADLYEEWQGNQPDEDDDWSIGV